MKIITVRRFPRQDMGAAITSVKSRYVYDESGRCKIYLSKRREKQRMLEYRRRSIKYGSRKLSVRTQHWIFQNPVFLSEYCKFLAAVCTGRRIPGSVDFENKNTGERQRHLSIFSAVSFYLEGFSYPRYYEMYRCMETDYDEKLKGVYCRSAHPFAPHKRYNAFLAASEPAYAYDGNLEAFCGTTSTITRLDASASALFQRPDIVVKEKTVQIPKRPFLFWAVCCSIKLCYSQEKKKNYSLYLESVNHLKRQGRYRKSFPILQLWKRNLKKQKRIIWKNIVR